MTEEIKYKTCNKCGIEKPHSEFGLLKSSKDGLRYECKNCKNEKSKIYRLKNKTPKKEKYDFPIRTIICKGCGKKETGNFSHMRKFCSDECAMKTKNKYNNILESKKKWVTKNKHRINDIKSKSFHKLKNSQKFIETRKRYNEKLEVRLKNALRSRIKKTLKTNQKQTGTTDIVGCSIKQLKSHIENQFQPGMTWDNWSQFGWHLDHIKPLSSAKNKEELYKFCHYTNLQPLWAKDNLQKSNKINQEWGNDKG